MDSELSIAAAFSNQISEQDTADLYTYKRERDGLMSLQMSEYEIFPLRNREVGPVMVILLSCCFRDFIM